MPDETFFEISPVLLSKMNKEVAEELEQAIKALEDNTFFYSTCPHCLKLSSFSKTEINQMSQKKVDVTSFKKAKGRLIHCPDCNSSYTDFFSKPYCDEDSAEAIACLVIFVLLCLGTVIAGIVL